MPDLLLEIGTEELPPNLIDLLLNQLKTNILTILKEHSVEVDKEDIKEFSTPRRIAIYIKNLPLKTKDKTTEIKGPPKNKAFDESGKATQVAIGFAKKYSLEVSDLSLKNFNGIDYIFITHQEKGEKLKNILEDKLPDALKKITGDKLMKWGNNNDKFIRPIRWVLAILDNEIINFNFATVKSGNKTYGHRFLASGETEIIDPKDYISTLEKNYVFADGEARKEKIRELLDNETRLLNTSLSSGSKSLLEVVCKICEYPKIIKCDFDEEFLNLPDIVIETVLEKHQKYFVLYKDKKIISQFLVITNGTGKDENIKTGNEKVAKARLNDAQFFFEEDLKRPFTFEERKKDLEKISFQKGLGSLKDKTERIISYSCAIATDIFNIDSNNINDIITAAELSKIDLTTHLVFEMPELQGVIGRIYAGRNTTESVSRSIEEHYSNTNTYSELSTIIGIADKIDNILCMFSLNKIPTSSSDPFGLINQIDWILKTCESGSLSIIQLLEVYYKKSNHLNIPIEHKNKVLEFIDNRLKVYLKEKCGNNDYIEAVLTSKNSIENISLTISRLEALMNLNLSNDFLQAAKRLIRIVSNETQRNKINENLFKTNEENKLYEAFLSVQKTKTEFTKKEDYIKYFENLKPLTKDINLFFDNVLVNDKDESIKNNRMALLNLGKTLLFELCDFNKIIERNHPHENLNH